MWSGLVVDAQGANKGLDFKPSDDCGEEQAFFTRITSMQQHMLQIKMVVLHAGAGAAL